MVSFFIMKEELLQLHLQMLQDKIDAFQDRVEALSEDAKNDAKSSAGDKHETALSMMHIEQEKLSAKINEYITQQQELLRIDISRKSTVIGLGSLIQANDLWFFLSSALPKVNVNTLAIYSLSKLSPLGNLLLGKTIGDEVLVNNVKYKIQQVL